MYLSLQINVYTERTKTKQDDDADTDGQPKKKRTKEFDEFTEAPDDLSVRITSATGLGHATLYAAQRTFESVAAAAADPDIQLIHNLLKGPNVSSFSLVGLHYRPLDHLL